VTWLCLRCRPLRWCSGGTAELRRHLAIRHQRHATPVVDLVDQRHRRLNPAGEVIGGNPRTNIDGWIRLDDSPVEAKAPAETAAGTWRDQAACVTSTEPDTWHPRQGRTSEVREALAICATCPVTAPCLKFALDNQLRDGVWGGTTANQRRRWRELKGATHE
jgi:WhiB family transcriptional regulator, redox-sensing transcriptional regulator